MKNKNRIREAISYSGLSFSSVAKKLGLRPSCFIKRVNTCSFTLKEQKKIAETIGCSNVVFEFVSVDGTRFKGETVKEIIGKAIKHRDITYREVGEYLFYSKQNFYQRLKTGKLSDEEMEKIATYLCCKYIRYFEFHNWERF